MHRELFFGYLFVIASLLVSTLFFAVIFRLPFGSGASFLVAEIAAFLWGARLALVASLGTTDGLRQLRNSLAFHAAIFLVVLLLACILWCFGDVIALSEDDVGLAYLVGMLCTLLFICCMQWRFFTFSSKLKIAPNSLSSTIPMQSDEDRDNPYVPPRQG